MKKKIVSLLTACLLMCSFSATSVSAAEVVPVQEVKIVQEESSARATDYFSGLTGTMNSYNGVQSRIFERSSGSIPSDAKITSVEAYVSVSSGSSPFYLVIKSPNGVMKETYVRSSGYYTLDFSGVNAYGTWQVYIYSTGGVSTATANVKYYYQYTQGGWDW